MFEERVKADLEPLHAQIPALTELMDRSIQGNSAREPNTANTRELRHKSKSFFTGAPGSSSFPTVTPLTTAGYSLDTPISSILTIYTVTLKETQICSDKVFKTGAGVEVRGVEKASKGGWG